MADTTWTNSSPGDRDFNTAGNFSGTVPEGTGTLFFTREFTTTGTGPNGSMAAHTAVDQDAIYVGEGYTEAIGASGNDMDISADKIWHRGSGKMWFKDGAGTTNWILADSTAPSPLTSILNIAAATTARLDVLRGGVTIDGTATVTDATVQKRDSAATDANLTIAAGATITTGVDQSAGVLTSDAALPLLRMTGGRCVQDTATIVTLIMWGGHLEFNASALTITDVFHYGGTIDVTQKGGLKTFTNYWFYPKAREGLMSTPETLAVGTEFASSKGSWS